MLYQVGFTRDRFAFRPLGSVALVVGAIAGGALGWTVMQQPNAADVPTANGAPEAVPDPETDAAPDMLFNQEPMLSAA